MTTNTHSSSKLYRCPATKVIGHTICERLYAFLKSQLINILHTWTYRRNKKVHFSLLSNIGKKLAACLLSQLSEYLCHLKAQYLIQFPNICSGKHILLLVHPVSATGWSCFCSLTLRRHTNSFSAVENNSMCFCISLTHI